MAKSGKHTGVSFTEEELSDPLPPVTITRTVLGGETQSAGNNSSASGEKLSSDSGSPTPNPRKPVSSTENRSSPQAKETGSAAHSAATGGPKTDQESGRKRTPPTTGKKAPAKDDSKKARVRSADGDDDNFSDFE